MNNSLAEEVWQEIEEKGGMKEDKNGEGDE